MQEIYNIAVKKGLEEAFSIERLERYKNWAQGDLHNAYTLYALNTAVSESLYTPLQILEVTLRNRINKVLAAAHGDDWLLNAQAIIISPFQKYELEKACTDIASTGRPVTQGRIIAALTFGFWTGMLSPKYEALWQRHLHQISRPSGHKSRTRKEIIRPLNPIRVLRNRIAHHEAIIHWNLPLHHEHMMTLTGWLCSEAEQWSRAHSRFACVYPAEGIRLCH